MELLRSVGLKATPQRIAIIKLLINGGHFSIDQVFNEVRVVEPTISISTVYNTLNALVKAGILRSFEANGKTWYEMRRDPHVNVICEDTGQIIDVDVNLAWVEEELRRSGIDVKDLNVIVRGNCSNASHS